MIHCTWNTADGNMDFRKNLLLKENTKQETEPVQKQQRIGVTVFFKFVVRNSNSVALMGKDQKSI